MKDLEKFIKANRKVCWESDYENGEFCIGENKIREYVSNRLEKLVTRSEQSKASQACAVAGIVWDLDDAESERSKLAGFSIFAMKCNQCFNIVGSVNNVKEITANYCSKCGAMLKKN